MQVADAMALRLKCAGGAAVPNGIETALGNQRRLRTYSGLIIRTGLSAGLLIWLFHNAPLQADFHLVFPHLLAVAVMILLFQPLAIAARWRLILRAAAPELHYRALSRIIYISIFFSQFLPASVGGDAVRVYYGHKLGGHLGPLVSSVIVDRAFALLALLLLVGGSVPVLSTRYPGQWAIPGLEWLAAAAAVGFLLLAFAARPIHRITRSRGQLQRVATITGTWAELASRPGSLIACIALSVCVHVLSCASVLLMAASLGIILPMVPAAAASLLIILAHSLPISIGGWGIREWTATATLTTFGISNSSALIISLTFGVSLLLTALPGSLLWVLSNQAKPAILRWH